MLTIGCMEKWSQANPREISLLASVLLVPVSSDQHWDTYSVLALSGVIPLKMRVWIPVSRVKVIPGITMRAIPIHRLKTEYILFKVNSDISSKMHEIPSQSKFGLICIGHMYWSHLDCFYVISSCNTLQQLPLSSRR